MSCTEMVETALKIASRHDCEELVESGVLKDDIEDIICKTKTFVIHSAGQSYDVRYMSSDKTVMHGMSDSLTYVFPTSLVRFDGTSVVYMYDLEAMVKMARLDSVSYRKLAVDAVQAKLESDGYTALDDLLLDQCLVEDVISAIYSGKAVWTVNGLKLPGNAVQEQDRMSKAMNNMEE